jgi:phosphoribosylaminoimidazolecarboxamide formyltransferase/IMP cyclohydrolase
VVVDPADYALILSEMKINGGGLTQATRFDLAVRTYEHTAAYDGAIANYLGKIVSGSEFPRSFSSQFHKKQLQ